MHLHVDLRHCTRSVCREVANGSLPRQGETVRSSDNSYKIAAGEPSIPETRGNVLGTRAGRKTRERSAFENDRENEPDMTTYPLEFHRRAEQKWVLRAQASSASESTPRAALAGSSQRGQRRSGHSERRDILAQRPWLREIGQWLRAGYDAVDQPVPDRLAALLKELKSRRH
jgi:Anti-sigma factor NepR